MSAQSANDDRNVQSVSELSLQLKQRLERDFAGVWVSGEVSSLTRPQSGHIYFTLRDENSQIRAVIWRSTAERLKFDVEEGQEFICHGDIDLYLPRGSYQLIVRKLEPVGVGELQLAFKKLFEKLKAEGLFDPENKKPLPKLPQRIAVITSPTGAAVRDFLQVAKRRWPLAEILVVPSRVQGDQAPGDIERALKIANGLRPKFDLLVLTRGGGSMEDLWCFNDERVVRAIHRCSVPVVSAVGHEIDVTLSDLVADRRALTPTEAAEIIVPDRREWLDALDEIKARLAGCLHNKAQMLQHRLELIGQRRVFQRPLDQLAEKYQRIDRAAEQMQLKADSMLEQNQMKLKQHAARLEALNPLAVLARGYSLTETGLGNVVRQSDQISVGDEIVSKFHWGEATSKVSDIKKRDE